MFNIFNEWHFLNIPDIFVTFEVLKLVKSKDCIEVHDSNMFDISVTWEVSKSLKFISIIFEASKNITWQSVKGSFQINSISLFSFSIFTLESVNSTSFPSINIWFGRFLNDLFKIFCSPTPLTFILILEVFSRCLNSIFFLSAKNIGIEIAKIKNIVNFLKRTSIWNFFNLIYFIIFFRK